MVDQTQESDHDALRLGVLKQTWERVAFELREFTVIVITVIAIVIVGAVIVVNTTDFQCAAQFLRRKQFTLLDGDRLLGKHAETACGGTNFKERRREELFVEEEHFLGEFASIAPRQLSLSTFEW